MCSPGPGRPLEDHRGALVRRPDRADQHLAPVRPGRFCASRFFAGRACPGAAAGQEVRRPAAADVGPADRRLDFRGLPPRRRPVGRDGPAGQRTRGD